MTKITAVGTGGDCPRFKQFLGEVMAGDEEKVAFVQRVLGYCLTGDVSEEVIFRLRFMAQGQNGKGVLDIHDRKVDPWRTNGPANRRATRSTTPAREKAGLLAGNNKRVQGGDETASGIAIRN